MTEEQIKEKAEAYADSMKEIRGELEWCATRDDFIAGAHSMLEEIEQLEWEKKHYQDIAWKLAAENDQLRNPWISVEDRLPEREVPYKSRHVVIIRHEHGVQLGYLDSAGRWVNFCNLFTYKKLKITHWMPIPELKEGE